MKRAASFFLAILILAACTAGDADLPAATISPDANTAAGLPAPAVTQAGEPIPQASSQGLKSYTNSAFGLSFQFPSSWYGPEAYVSDQTLRLEIGSDRVYPYGEPPEQPSTVRNSYHIVIQYSQNDQGQSSSDTYQSLVRMKDGESLAGSRSLIIRVRQLNLGPLSGFEYIATLSETAQTEPVYLREALLMDERSNVLSVMGSPSNVEVPEGSSWREVYQQIDLANLAVFQQVLASIKIE